MKFRQQLTTGGDDRFFEFFSDYCVNLSDDITLLA
jgi:hypothetical protein